MTVLEASGEGQSCHVVYCRQHEATRMQADTDTSRVRDLNKSQSREQRALKDTGASCGMTRAAMLRWAQQTS